MTQSSAFEYHFVDFSETLRQTLGRMTKTEF